MLSDKTKPTVERFIQKFGKVVTIDPDHPLVAEQDRIEAAAKAAPAKPDYGAFTVPVLKAMAEKRSLTVEDGAKKQDLIELLTAADAAGV